jgi:DNA polymerase III subunit delta
MNKLFHGKDNFLSLRKAKEEVKELLKDPSYENISVEGDKVDTEELLEILDTSSLFTDKRVIFLKRQYRSKKRKTLIPALIEFLEKENPNTSLIIWEDQKIKGNTKYYKYFKESNSVEEFDELNKRTFSTWAKKEIENYKISLDTSLIKVLSERTNYSTESFVHELEKLELTGKDKFNIEDIKENTEDTLEYDIWKLIDSINSKDKISNRMEVLENMLSNGIDPNYIIAMLARNLRLVVQLKELLEENTSSREIASILKIPPFTIPKMQIIAKEYSFEKISLLYEKLSSLDFEIKKGRIEPGLGLTLMVSKF